MNCVVTAGPTYEPLDEVRRLTNISTGKLGSELANFLVEQGHDVTLLLGHDARYAGKQNARRVELFTTSSDLKSRLQALVGTPVHALLHAAAVSDFAFGKAWTHTAAGNRVELKEKKISTGHGQVLVELLPTPKIIGQLRDWFPQARLVGWKYEPDGDRTSVLAKARAQITRNRTNASVANGPGYGEGYGLVVETGQSKHLPDAMSLYRALAKLIAS
jgi:phosphopantothenoylcysteine synthetase/decarboxylase